MYWEEPRAPEEYIVSDDVIDLVFNITCRCLPVDHAYALSQALHETLPWLNREKRAGVHPIHVAETSHGWTRPQGPNDLLYLSRRTKMVLRLPKHRIKDAGQLIGKILDVADHSLQVNKFAVRSLSTITTIFSRRITAGGSEDEEAFLNDVVQQLGAMGVKPKKMLCGLEKTISTPEKNIRTRSLLIADLNVEESVRLQQRGLGLHRHLGCGLFIPHKDIKAVIKTPSDAI